MKRIIKKAPRYIVAALLIAAILAFGATSFASSYPKQMAATTPLNVRSGPGTRYSIIGELYTGQEVTVTGAKGRWGIISYGNVTGYAHLSYLRDVGSYYSESTVSGNTLYVSSNAMVYSGPGTGYTVIGTLNQGSTVTRTGTTGSWTQISWNGGTGYIYSSYLSGGTSYYNYNYNPITVTSASGTYYVNRTANVRSGPGSAYPVLNVIYPNQTVTRTGIAGSWTQVNYNGTTGYIYSAYLSPYYSTPVYTPPTYYSPYYYDSYPYYSASAYLGQCYALASTNVYELKDNTSTVKGYVVANQSVTCTGYYGTWSYINFYDFTAATTASGFIPSMYLRSAY